MDTCYFKSFEFDNIYENFDQSKFPNSIIASNANPTSIRNRDKLKSLIFFPHMLIYLDVKNFCSIETLKNRLKVCLLSMRLIQLTA